MFPARAGGQDKTIAKGIFALPLNLRKQTPFKDY